ncbi:MAG: response regulator [Verrucomicrobiae bacterium]|nr:response regulator [Verrucomicrobiae bacterium]
MAELGKEVLSAFRRHERSIGLQRLRLGCWIAMALTPPGLVIDVLYYKPKQDVSVDIIVLLFIRLICTAAILPILYLSWQRFGIRHYRLLGVLLAAAPALCMALIIGVTDGTASPYYAGLNLVLLGVGMVMQWTLVQSLSAAVMVIVMYLGAVILSPSSFQAGIFLNNIWFMLLTSIIVVIGSQVSSKLRFSDFVSRHNLDRSRHDLEATNERLGETNQRLAETNQRMRELDELKGRFFANISHELRTPLTLLLGPIEHLSQHPAIVRDERLREYVGTMQDNALRLLKLINDLLDLVRLDAGQFRLHKVRFEVATFTAGLLNAVRRFAEDRGLRVSCNNAPELSEMCGDPDKLEKVLLNLLFNSIKFTPAGGEVRLNGYRDGPWVVFEVRDTGMGISPENLAQLFQRFWQADSSSHRKYQGAGLGLALVKELVEAHGGEVMARSEVGKGTTMTVRLPLEGEGEAAKGTGRAAAPAGEKGNEATGHGTAGGDAGPAGVAVGAASRPVEGDGGRNGSGAGEEEVEGEGVEAGVEAGGSGTPAGFETRRHLAALYKRAELHASITPLRASLRPWDPGRGGNRPEILVVDDEPDMLRFLRSQLEDDYQVREAVDGDQATVMASQYLPDAVVCDMMLPEKDGLQVCRELRANHTTRSLPFLMLTARADDETKLAALGAGASDFLPKPFSTAELKLRLKNLVDAHRLQEELARQNRKLASTLEELRETEMQLVQAEKMASLGRLSAGIIHEINNPLNFARTGLHVLKRHSQHIPAELREEYDEVLQDIGDGIVRVSTIVGDLRQFSHPQGDAVAEVDVGTAVEAALRFLSADWKDGRVDVANEIPEGFVVYANRNKLVQVLLNLCQNAIDAMRDHPPAEGKARLQLRAWQEDGRRRLGVRDNGPGIPANHLAHIFEPFYTTKDVGKGMGLGLSICYRIMEEVGGRITVDTEEGQYCEFVLDFPDRFDDKEAEG